ncbi:MAG: flagellar hook-associated protein FlgL, partial [Deltaproteobacteria bacterium]|nr:flagellar hook-associated protein FlgL [Deltaproteobacteria bacterium]
MVMRISENIKFNTIVDNMFKSQDSYNKLAEKIASLKEINRPSDDPIGMNRVLNLRESRASVEQYTRNMDGCESWLTITESKLSAAGDLLVKAREIAVAQSTATSSAESRSSEAETVQQLIDEMLALANSKYNGRYLFSGAKTEEAPFSSSGRSAAEIGEPVQAGGNGDFDGDVDKSGTYTGDINKTYVVKIVTDGEMLADTTYRVSDDGGKTWSDPPSGDLADGVPITLGDGVQLTFTEGVTNNLSKDDIFYVHAFAADPAHCSYYNGNGGELSVNIGEGAPFAYSISGEAAFTDKGNGEVEIFKVLSDLKGFLEANDPSGIASCIDDL